MLSESRAKSLKIPGLQSPVFSCQLLVAGIDIPDVRVGFLCCRDQRP